MVELHFTVKIIHVGTTKLKNPENLTQIECIPASQLLFLLQVGRLELFPGEDTAITNRDTESKANFQILAS